MSIDPPDSVFKVRPGKDVFNIAGPLRGVKSGSNQASVVQMGGSDLASKCFGGITWSGMGDPEQMAQGGALACVVVGIAAREVGWGECGNKADENGYAAAGAQGKGEGRGYCWHLATL